MRVFCRTPRRRLFTDTTTTTVTRSDVVGDERKRFSSHGRDVKNPESIHSRSFLDTAPRRRPTGSSSAVLSGPRGGISRQRVRLTFSGSRACRYSQSVHARVYARGFRPVTRIPVNTHTRAHTYCTGEYDVILVCTCTVLGLGKNRRVGGDPMSCKKKIM